MASLLFIGAGVVTGAPPEITAQPESRTNVAGTEATFTAAAAGTGPFQYRWRRDGLDMANSVRITGTASDTLTIADARLADAGNYTLAVSNVDGFAISDVATLTVAVPEEVVFPDLNLQAAIRSAINKPLGLLNTADLSVLTSLSACRLGIAELSGLEWATNLASLDLSGNSITGLAPLHSLNSLVHLSLDDNHISDLSPLASLFSLTSLNLGNNGISEGSVLSGLTNLTSLSLYRNPINSLTGLTNLRGLTALALHNSGLTDLSPIAGLTNLSYLELRWNPLTNVSAVLAGLTNLSTLYLGGTSISNVGFLQNLTQLAFLNLDHNGIRDLSPLAGLPNLRGLDLGYNPLTNVAQVGALTNLTSLFLSGNSISNLAMLQTLSQLTSLTLYSNLIGDLSPMTSLTNLSDLGLSWNPISDYQMLSACSNLTSLWLAGNSISNLSFAQGLTRLNALGLRHNRLSDLAGLGGLTNLIALHADYNRLTDIEVLQNLPSLSSAGLIVNLLDLSLGSPAMTTIQSLQNRAASVTYQPQNQPPSISIGTDWIVAANTMSSRNFSLSDDFTQADQLLVAAHSSNTELLSVQSVTLDNAGSLRTLIVTPGSNQIGTATINLTVTDGAGSVTAAGIVITVQNATNVSIPNPDLEALLRQVLRMPSGALNSVDLLALTELYVGDPAITSLSGLEWAVNLTNLFLVGTSVTNLGALQNLTILESLTLYNNPIGFLDLGGLTNLTALDLAGNSISDLSFLQNLVQLTSLSVSETAVTNAAPVAGLTNLTSLYLAGFSISNLTFLQNLSKLTSLSLINSRLTDASPLAALTNLVLLDLQGNRLADVSPLTNLVNVSSLDLRLNLLETTTNSALEYLQAQNVNVLADPQREPPVFVTPGSWFVAANRTSYVRFSASDGGPPNEFLTITASSSDGSLIPNTNVILNPDQKGPASDWILTVIPPANYTGASTITLIAANQVSMSATTTVNLTIAMPLPLDDQVLEGANLTWLTGGAAPWFGQTNISHDGVSAAQSGSILDNAESWLEATVTGPGSLSFWWKVSSESLYDGLGFYLNNVLTGTPVSGDGAWAKRTVTIPTGTQTIKWRYSKDQDFSLGLDAAWLDQVIFKPAALVTLGALNPVYDGTAHPATASTTPSGLTVDLTYNSSASLPTNAGSYQVIGIVNNPNYVGAATNTLTIALATLTASAEHKSRAYGEANPPFTVSYAGFFGEDDAFDLNSPPTASTTATITSPAGNYNISLTGGADNNYSFNLVSGTLTITNVVPAPLITAINLTNGVTVITWIASVGHNYRLQYKADLTDANWVDLSPDVPATGSSAAGTNFVGDLNHRFYRVMRVE